MEKLFYQDAYRTAAEATVLQCTPAAGGWAVTLDQTIFYPTGGGQPCDLGTLGQANVTDVSETDGKIVHLCDREVTVGEAVALRIDFARRFVFMQQHTAEHIVSGLIRKHYGRNNVGFHMGAKAVTLDFDGELTAEMLQTIETESNRLLWRNEAVRCFYPEDLSAYDYRSKKALSGQVRLVEVPNADLCACCGLHVARTGELGLIHLGNAVRFRGGTRLELLCGEKALMLLQSLSNQSAAISALLSAKPTELSEAVSRLSQEKLLAEQRMVQLEDRLFSLRAQEVADLKNVIIFEEQLSPDALRRFANMLLLRGVLRCAIFSEGRYALAAQQDDLREFSKMLNAALGGRGGGKPNFIQGSLSASRGEIEAFFSTYWGGK